MTQKRSILFIAIAFILIIISCNKTGPFDFRKKYKGRWRIHEKHVDSYMANTTITFYDHELDVKLPKLQLRPIKTNTFEIIIGETAYTINKEGQFLICASGGFFSEDSLAVSFFDCGTGLGSSHTYTMTGTKIK